jgi:hypothetical protein
MTIFYGGKNVGCDVLGYDIEYSDMCFPLFLRSLLPPYASGDIDNTFL